MRTTISVLLAITCGALAGLATQPAAGQDRGRRASATVGPAVGAAAPDFDLPRLVDGKADPARRVRLSALRGKPVALIFGSYT